MALGAEISAPPKLDAQHMLRLAMQHHHQGDLQKADMIYRRLLKDDPENADTLHLHGILSVQAGKHDAAIELMEQAISIKGDDPRFHYNLGKVHQDQARFEKAIACYTQAIKIDSRFADAYINLARIYKDLGVLDQAILYSRHAVALLPTDPEVHYNLGTALMAQGEIEEAIACYRRALELKPDFAKAHDNLGNALKERGEIEQAIACYWRALELKPDFTETHSNLLFALNYEETRTPEQIAAEHRNFGLAYQLQKSAINTGFTHAADPDRILRIGYVSADFFDHSCAYFFEPLLRAHDRSKVEIFCYSGVQSPDATTQRFRHLADQWRDICRIDDPKLAPLIETDGIDILVDLSGHTAGGRLSVFARRVAPVQVSWLGYPNTTGLFTMDYKLTDRLVDPEGLTDHLYTERLVRLPVSFLCYQAPFGAPSVSAPPCIESGHITFGCFNNASKVTPAVIALWAMILHAVPGSKLILKARQFSDSATRQRYISLFASHRITSDRLIISGPLPKKQDHLSAYNAIDIGLDPFPYNGTTTSCEALWMGVPFITLAGKTHAGRVGSALLHNLHLDELVARDTDDYLHKAAELAGNILLLTEWRKDFRHLIETSPLCDANRFADNIEEAYRRMWTEWCKHPHKPVQTP